MQKDLADDISIVGVNGVGLESGNEGFCEGRTLPWLQDVEETQAWTLWDVEYRDVVVLDRDGVIVAYFNLTLYDLGVAENYTSLRDLLEEVASW